MGAVHTRPEREQEQGRVGCRPWPQVSGCWQAGAYTRLLLDCWEFLATRLCQAWNFFTAFWRLA